MPESKHEQIAAAIVTRLAAIVGDSGVNYHYTPTKVKRTHGITAELLDATLETVYALIPDEEEAIEGVTFMVHKLARLDLVLLRRFTPASENPFSADEPIRWTVQDRLVRDAEKKLREDINLGGLSENLEITMVDRTAERTYVAGWAVAFLHLLVRYSHFHDSP